MPLPQDLVKDWPAELREDPSIKDLPDVRTLAQNLVQTKALVGQSLRPPGADAAPEVHKEFAEKLGKAVKGKILYLPEDEKAAAAVEAEVWGALGRPKEAAEYPPPKDLELPAEALEALRKEALEEGLTKRQFEARAKKAASVLSSRAGAAQELQKALKKELGPEYDTRVAAAAAAAEKLGFPPALVADVKAGQVDVATFKGLYQVAKGFGQKPEIAAQGGGGGGGGSTPAEAVAQAAEIRARPEYWDRSKNPALYEALQRKHLELMKVAYPDDA